MKFIFAFILAAISQYSFGQEHSSLFQPEVMKKNRVLKVLEYHPEDSLAFFKKYPEGYYSKYNKEGRMIESNHYSSYEHEGIWYPNMFINYYVYDSLGEQIAFISKFEDGDQPFRYINVTLPRKTGDSVDIVSLKDQYKPGFRMLTESTNEKEPFFRDTIDLGKRHKRLISVEDSTIYMDLYFNKQGLKDSMIFYGNGYTHTGRKSTPYTSRNTMHYSYFKDGTLKSVVKRTYNTTNGITKLYSGEKYFFLENGLLDQMGNYFGDTENKLVYSKFIYTFRKE